MKRGINFNHGTGHGVGYLMNIHEAPCGFRIAVRKREKQPLMPGLVITDEPGIYIEGSHGVRTKMSWWYEKARRTNTDNSCTLSPSPTFPSIWTPSFRK